MTALDISEPVENDPADRKSGKWEWYKAICRNIFAAMDPNATRVPRKTKTEHIVYGSVFLGYVSLIAIGNIGMAGASAYQEEMVTLAEEAASIEGTGEWEGYKEYDLESLPWQQFEALVTTHQHSKKYEDRDGDGQFDFLYVPNVDKTD